VVMKKTVMMKIYLTYNNDETVCVVVLIFVIGCCDCLATKISRISYEMRSLSSKWLRACLGELFCVIGNFWLDDIGISRKTSSFHNSFIQVHWTAVEI